MPRYNRAQTERRRQAVEAVLLAGQLTRPKAHRLATQWGVHVATIYRDKQWILDDYVANRTPTEQERQRQLMQIESDMELCRAKGHFGPLASFHGLRAAMTGTREPLRVQLDVRVEAATMSPLEQARLIVEHYEDARRLLIEAGELEDVVDVEYHEAL